MIILNNKYYIIMSTIMSTIMSNIMTLGYLINISCYKLYSFCIYIKYFFYFNLFLSSLSLTLVSYKITGKNNHKLAYCLYYSIRINGCMLIKFVQWIATNFNSLSIYNDSYIIELFSQFYENCSIHNLNYTKKIFKQEFGYEFDDIFIIDHSFSVKSGSIAQVYKASFKLNDSSSNLLNNNNNNNNNNYNTQAFTDKIAIKVVHPEVEYQMVFPILLFKLYKFMVTNIGFLKKYNTPFNFDSFFDNLKCQIDMKNEIKNMNYFYNYYSDNPFIVIPKPIISSKNCLIMEYVDGTPLEKMDISEFEKQKIFTLLCLFVKDNYMFLDYYHSDLHDSNWKVCLYNNFYQLVIYDFGYIIKKQTDELYKNLSYYIDNDMYLETGKLLYPFLKNSTISKENFSNLYFNYITNNIVLNTDVEKFKLTYKFCYDNNYILDNYLLELFVSLILLAEKMEYYFSSKNNMTDPTVKYNCILQKNIHFYNFCEKYEIFNNVMDYIKNYYIDNPVINSKYRCSNLMLDKISYSGSGSEDEIGIDI